MDTQLEEHYAKLHDIVTSGDSAKYDRWMDVAYKLIHSLELTDEERQEFVIEQHQLDITDIFEYKGSTFRAEEFLKILGTSSTGWTTAEYTTFENATHVCGRGVAGCVAPIGEVKYLGPVDWHRDVVQRHKAEFYSHIGERVTY